ncbi:uncharacterized protein LOC115605467 isoform X2 [Strigops habroptila]|uniref:uncharacterized protein LOC115605467 isoform X2 n=1 Tax=Strigops habroptila TaxID=2489341 RepID=UPI0011CFA01E|nr:uncharacterized protein LOC115605467 isoform X2 [Strigops habroptila]
MVEIMNHHGRVSPGTAASAEERCCSWLNPWVFIASVLAIKTTIVTICLVVFLHGSYGQYMTLVQNATEWRCIPSVSAGKKEGWSCCPKGWKRFQGSCYYLSDDVMSWAASEQNCTGMGSHLVVINSKAEQVCAGLRGGTAARAPAPAQEGTQPLFVLKGREDVLCASLQYQFPSATSPAPQGLLPPPSAQSCISWTLHSPPFPGFPLQLGKRSIYYCLRNKILHRLNCLQNWAMAVGGSDSI